MYCAGRGGITEWDLGRRCPDLLPLTQSLVAGANWRGIAFLWRSSLSRTGLEHEDVQKNTKLLARFDSGLPPLY